MRSKTCSPFGKKESGICCSSSVSLSLRISSYIVEVIHEFGINDKGIAYHGCAYYLCFGVLQHHKICNITACSSSQEMHDTRQCLYNKQSCKHSAIEVICKALTSLAKWTNLKQFPASPLCVATFMFHSYDKLKTRRYPCVNRNRQSQLKTRNNCVVILDFRKIDLPNFSRNLLTDSEQSRSALDHLNDAHVIHKENDNSPCTNSRRQSGSKRRYSVIVVLVFSKHF